MPDDFDPLGLARAPKLDVPGALALSLRLLGDAPDQPTHPVASALEQLRLARAELAEHATGAVSPHRTGANRLADDEAAMAWRALYTRLESYTQLPSDRYPNAARAAALISCLFPTGIDFLRQPAAMRQAELLGRFAILRADQVTNELEVVAGIDFAEAVYRTMAVRGVAEDSTAERPPLAAPVAGAVPAAVAEALRSLRRAIASYLLSLVTMHDEGNSAARIAVRSAFRPVTELEAGPPQSAAAPPRRAPRVAQLRRVS